MLPHLTFVVVYLYTMNQIIIDVRTPEEWATGHADNTRLIPLDVLEQHISSLQGYEKIKIVCRSGARAEHAAGILKMHGFQQVENLGPWQNALA